jgi:hypothetical protein
MPDLWLRRRLYRVRKLLRSAHVAQHLGQTENNRRSSLCKSPATPHENSEVIKHSQFSEQ